MRVKLIEGTWTYRVNSPAKQLRKAVTLYRFEDIIEAAKEIYDKITELVKHGKETNREQIIDRIPELKNEWETFDINTYIDKNNPYETQLLEEKIQELLDKLYDFCDENRIWLAKAKD